MSGVLPGSVRDVRGCVRDVLLVSRFWSPALSGVSCRCPAYVPPCPAHVPPCPALIPPCPALVPPMSRPCPALVPPVSRPCPARVPPVSRPCPVMSRVCPATSRPCPATSRPCPAYVPKHNRSTDVYLDSVLLSSRLSCHAHFMSRRVS